MGNLEEAVSMTRGFESDAPARPDAPSLGNREPSLFRKIQLSLLLRRFTANYFAQLEVEFESLCPSDYKSRLKHELATLRASNEHRPNWTCNHRLEYLLLAGLPPVILRQRSLVHRARLMALVGPEGNATFSEAFRAPAAMPKDDDELRTESLGVLVEIQRLRHVQTEFERLRNRLIAISMVPGFVFVALALKFSGEFWQMPLAQVAAILGFLGGYLSVLLRIGSLRWALRYAANYQQVDRLFWNLFLNFYLSLLEGSLGAIVLYITLSAGVFTTGLFPTIPGDGHELLKASVLTHAELARLMLWSIVAGFSERAVPDFLSGLSKELIRKPDASASAEQPVKAGAGSL